MTKLSRDHRRAYLSQKNQEYLPETLHSCHHRPTCTAQWNRLPTVRTGRTGRIGRTGKTRRIGRIGRTGRTGRTGRIGRIGRTGRIWQNWQNLADRVFCTCSTRVESCTGLVDSPRRMRAYPPMHKLPCHWRVQPGCRIRRDFGVPPQRVSTSTDWTRTSSRSNQMVRKRILKRLPARTVWTKPAAVRSPRRKGTVSKPMMKKPVATKAMLRRQSGRARKEKHRWGCWYSAWSSPEWYLNLDGGDSGPGATATHERAWAEQDSLRSPLAGM